MPVSVGENVRNVGRGRKSIVQIFDIYLVLGYYLKWCSQTNFGTFLVVGFDLFMEKEVGEHM